MSKYFLLVFGYYVSWIPFFIWRNSILQVVFNEELVFKGELKELTFVYLIFSLFFLSIFFNFFLDQRIREEVKGKVRLEKEIQYLVTEKTKLEKLFQKVKVKRN